MEKPSMGKTCEKSTKIDAHADRRRMESARDTAKPAFNSAVAYLKRRAEKGKLASTGPAEAPVFERIAKSHARQLNRIEKGLTTSQATAATLSANSAAFAVKGVGGMAKAARHLPSGAQAAAMGAKMDMAASSAGIAINSVGLATSASRFHSARRKKNATIKAMTESLGMARLHVEDPSRATAETAAAYRTFMAASKLVVHKHEENWIEETSDSNLTQHQAGATVARYAINTSSSTISTAAACANSVATTPVGPFLTVGIGAAEMAAAHVTLESGRRKSRSLRGKLGQLESWRYLRRNASLKLPVVGIYEACRGELRRQERLASWVKRGAKVQFAKATGNITLGLTGGVLAALGLAAVVGAAAITAGIAVVAAGALLSAGFLGFAVVRAIRSARSERHCKRRQKEAQGLIATNTHQELQRLMGETDAQKRKATAIMIERGGFLHAGTRALRVATVDAGRNAYVGLHLMAHELAQMVGSSNSASRPPADAVLAFLDTPEDVQQSDQYVTQEQGAILRLLQVTGMSAFDIQALCLAASAMDGEDQLCYLKQAIAGAIGIPFQVAADGREKPLTPFAYLAPIEDLMKGASFSANVNSGKQADNLAAAKALFERVDFYAFAVALEDPALPAGADGSVAHIARKLLDVEEARRMRILRTHFKDDGSAISALRTVPGFNGRAARRLAGFMRQHSVEIGSSAGSARSHLHSARTASWLPLWRAAEATGALPDAPWVALVREMASRI